MYQSHSINNSKPCSNHGYETIKAKKEHLTIITVPAYAPADISDYL